MRILFWGTPDFALPSLRALLGEGHDVVGVVTRPDRRAGRGRAVRASPVKECAESEHLPVLQPERARGADFLTHLRALEPELSVVVAYGQILRPEVLALPPRGSLNVHASLLPELRGAAPINWAIIRGHAETGITVMRMVARMDAGPILLQVSEPIGEDETASDLSARLSEIGAEALIETLTLLEEGGLSEREQDESRVTFAPRLERKDARIDWNLDAESVARWMRGLDEAPGAWTLLDRTEVKLFRPLALPQLPATAEPGTVLGASAHDPSAGVLVACGAGAVHVREVKPAGKRRMTAAEWVRGRGVRSGDRLG
ncbi:MAG: methionyl-tRNA formyltransferase [Gemmatimonadetes bacterium]|nr:methionyl-tRNA formyltransferase [Gemmatimonadota bacterium]